MKIVETRSSQRAAIEFKFIISSYDENLERNVLIGEMYSLHDIFY